jgi:hypothetical protein
MLRGQVRFTSKNGPLMTFLPFSGDLLVTCFKPASDRPGSQLTEKSRTAELGEFLRVIALHSRHDEQELPKQAGSLITLPASICASPCSPRLW